MRFLIVAVTLLAAAPVDADTLTPITRAKATIAAQIAQYKQGAAGQKAFLAQFDPQGLIVARMAVVSPKEVADLATDTSDSGSDYWTRQAIMDLFAVKMSASEPHRRLVTASSANVIAGGTADAVWFSFDLTETLELSQDGKTAWWKRTTKHRISELLVDRGGWKVALFHIDQPSPDSWDDEEGHDGVSLDGGAFPDADEAVGALAKLAVTPVALTKVLVKGPATFVIGSSETDRGIGDAGAAKLLAGWRKLKLEVLQSVEQKTKTWGHAVVELKLRGGKPGQYMKLRASIVGIAKPDGTWQVAAVRYSRFMW